MRDVLRRPCKPRGYEDCNNSARARVADLLDKMLADGASLAAELCGAAPELESALGPTTCVHSVAAYLFSSADYLGSNRLIDDD